MSNLEWITAIATAVAAMAASIAAVASIWIIFIYRKQVKISQEQVKISQEQVKISQEQVYDQHRPVIMISFSKQPENLIVENVGSGVALNIQGVYFQTKSKYAENSFMITALEIPLPAGQQIKVKEGLKPILSSDTEIGEDPKHTLIPTESTKALWRITLTYHDIFGRKYASIFDGYEYGAQTETKCVNVLFNIPKDLEDLEREAISEREV